ncbi:glutamate--tRNA ligase family protein [Chitinophaga cymbidii]|nr:glutamate--tRNA ligase family protein [Chitinophaga cymbidii]
MYFTAEMTAPQHITKTRLAPTPSGFLHLGNAFSFALTAALAQQASAKILLRIDDLDRERVEEKYVQDIFDTLHFLGIPWHEGPRDHHEYQSIYSQLHRLPLYNEALQQLKNSGMLFACECSRAQISNGIYPGTCRNKNLPLDGKNLNWRLRTNEEKTLTVRIPGGKSLASTLPAEMRDFVVRKKDGFPAYQLASLVDDRFFNVDLIVRGEDLWPSTLAQLYLADVLQYEKFRESIFYHHPLLLEAGDRKLSKSAGATSIQFLRKEGKTREDIYGMIAQMMQIKAPVSDYISLWEALIKEHPESGI